MHDQTTCAWVNDPSLKNAQPLYFRQSVYPCRIPFPYSLYAIQHTGSRKTATFAQELFFIFQSPEKKILSVYAPNTGMPFCRIPIQGNAVNASREVSYSYRKKSSKSIFSGTKAGYTGNDHRSQTPKRPFQLF